MPGPELHPVQGGLGGTANAIVRKGASGAGYYRALCQLHDRRTCAVHNLTSILYLRKWRLSAVDTITWVTGIVSVKAMV